MTFLIDLEAYRETQTPHTSHGGGAGEQGCGDRRPQLGQAERGRLVQAPADGCQRKACVRAV